MDIESYFSENLIKNITSYFKEENYLEQGNYYKAILIFKDIVETRRAYLSYIFNKKFDLLYNMYSKPIKDFDMLYFAHIGLFEEVKSFLDNEEFDIIKINKEKIEDTNFYEIQNNNLYLIEQIKENFDEEEFNALFNHFIMEEM